ncbi:hypothetical protein [Streptomyces sp. Inha503]|uniref:hypothetical protein n=1 Tax=Streptomyces sp. Inha503 TaxID=3383314 RepID=UPI0039A07E36
MGRSGRPVLPPGEDYQHGNALALVDRFLYDHHADGVAVETWGQADPTGDHLR